MTPRVVAEMESSSTLSAAVASGVGATILPVSLARSVAATAAVDVGRLVSPHIEIPLALCASDHLPLSEPAQVVKGILMELGQSPRVGWRHAHCALTVRELLKRPFARVAARPCSCPASRRSSGGTSARNGPGP